MRDALSESLYTLLLDLNRQWSQPPMNILRVIRNEFFHLLGTDHIAVDANGVPIARATDRAAVERAAPHAAAYFSGADFEPPEKPVAEPLLVSPDIAANISDPMGGHTKEDLEPARKPGLGGGVPPGWVPGTDMLTNPAAETAVKPSDEQVQTTNQVSDKDDSATTAKSQVKLN